MIVHWQNPVPGLEHRVSHVAHCRVSGIFMRNVRLTSEQWWGVRGSRKARRVSYVTGSSNPVRLTTREIRTSGGD